MKKLFLIILLSFSLSGCWWTRPDEPVLPPSKESIALDKEYLTECKDLKVLEDQTFEAVLSNTIDNVAIYKECKNKQHNSILLIKKFANIKD